MVLTRLSDCDGGIYDTTTLFVVKSEGVYGLRAQERRREDQCADQQRFRP